MKIAYVVLVHRNPEQLRRLITALDGTGDFYIHVDKKSKIEPFEQALAGIPNVNLLKNRINVYWGGWSMVQAYMLMFDMAYSSPKGYDRFVMLTSEDYPLISNEKIIEEFEKNRDVEYIMAYNIATSTMPTDENKVLRRWYLDCPFRNKFLQRVYRSIMYRTITKNFKGKQLQVPLGDRLVDPYFGQMLSAFTRAGMGMILDVYKNDKAFNKRMKSAFAAVELYWQTIIFNSELRKNTVQGGEEHEITPHFGWAPLHYHNYDVDTSVYTEKDFDEVMGSGYMFCRKTVLGVSDKLVEMIDEARAKE